MLGLLFWRHLNNIRNEMIFFFLLFLLANNKIFPTALLYSFLSFVFNFMCRISSTPNRFVKQTICVCFCSTHAHIHSQYTYSFIRFVQNRLYPNHLNVLWIIYTTMMRTTNECDRDARLLCFFDVVAYIVLPL